MCFPFQCFVYFKDMMVELSSDEDFKKWFLKESDFDKNTALHLAVMHKVDYFYVQ